MHTYCDNMLSIQTSLIKSLWHLLHTQDFTLEPNKEREHTRERGWNTRLKKTEDWLREKMGKPMPKLRAVTVLTPLTKSALLF